MLTATQAELDRPKKVVLTQAKYVTVGGGGRGEEDRGGRADGPGAAGRGASAKRWDGGAGGGGGSRQVDGGAGGTVKAPQAR